jgi:hypothetical protein
MTRKDYKLIADVIKASRSVPSAIHLRNFALDLSIELQKENPNFKPALFLKACGLGITPRS